MLVAGNWSTRPVWMKHNCSWCCRHAVFLKGAKHALLTSSALLGRWKHAPQLRVRPLLLLLLRLLRRTQASPLLVALRSQCGGAPVVLPGATHRRLPLVVVAGSSGRL